jgi:hypothetical protein
MYAALMALGHEVAAIAEMTQQLWTRGITRQRSYRDFFSILLPGLLKFDERFGLLDDHLVMERLRVCENNLTSTGFRCRCSGSVNSGLGLNYRWQAISIRIGCS